MFYARLAAGHLSPGEANHEVGYSSILGRLTQRAVYYGEIMFEHCSISSLDPFHPLLAKGTTGDTTKQLMA